MEDWSKGPRWKPQRAWGNSNVAEGAKDANHHGEPSGRKYGVPKGPATGFGRTDLMVTGGVGVLLAFILFATGFGGLGDTGSTANISDENPTTAWLQLAALDVVADGPSVDAPPYDRENFGKGWGDLDGDGCNTRNEILARDLENVTYEPHTGDCVVETGTLMEPYTGKPTDFVKGADTSALVQIDHVVALGDAWHAGAWRWDETTRHMFSNDPLNLLAVDGHQNYVKGALTANEWLPPDESFHCQFAIRQVAVKHKWDLSVQVKEKETLQKVLSKCEEQELDP